MKILSKIPLVDTIYSRYLAWKHQDYRCFDFQQFAALDCFDQSTLAIVGNAGYLSEIQQGQKIDSHDVVLRMNNFRTTGFHRSLGLRTDVFLTNFYPPHIDFKNPDLKQVKHVISSRPTSMQRMWPDGHRLGLHVSAGMKILSHHTVYAPQVDYFQQLSTALGAYPTTGMIAIQFVIDYLANRCNKIYITGFSFFSCQSHYFSDQKTTGIDHQVQNEKDLLREQLQGSTNIILDPVMAEHLDLQSLAENNSNRNVA